MCLESRAPRRSERLSAVSPHRLSLNKQALRIYDSLPFFELSPERISSLCKYRHFKSLHSSKSYTYFRIFACTISIFFFLCKIYFYSRIQDGLLDDERLLNVAEWLFSSYSYGISVNIRYALRNFYLCRLFCSESRFSYAHPCVPRLSIFQSSRFYRDWHFVLISHPPFVLIYLILVDISDLWKFHLL